MSLYEIFKILLARFGKQHWWPSKSIDETIIGAILTQNTSWQNVEKSLEILRENNLISLEKIKACQNLEEYIKPSGFFNQKAKYLKEAARNIDKAKMQSLPLSDARKLLLKIKGIGKETADSILLYALQKPIFVVDAYTKRIFSRLGFVKPDAKYDEIQKLFMTELDHNTYLFNEYHALIVKLAKEFCSKRNPDCKNCPLNTMCKFYKRSDKIENPDSA